MEVLNFSNYDINESNTTDVFNNIKTLYTIDLSHEINEMNKYLKNFCIEYNITPTSDLVDFFVDDLVDEILKCSRNFNLYDFIEKFNYDSFTDYFKIKIQENELEEQDQIKKIDKSKKFNI